MRKLLQFALAFSMSTLFVQAQQTFKIFDKVVYYDGYAGTVDEPVQEGVVRINNARYTTKLEPTTVNALSQGSLEMDITIGALCDNYDRLGEVFLALVPKGQTEYDSNEVEKLEIGRIITPFMNKNISPTEVPFHFKIDNVSEIFKDANLNALYDFWIEMEVFGVPYAANTQVPGCAGRNDVFEGTLEFTVSERVETYEDEHALIPLQAYKNLNNYNSTDVPGQTTRIIEFTLDQAVNDAVLYLVTSNHGANNGGEEYERRWHYVYLNDELVHEYMPGGKSCEPYRVYNTQGNGIYGTTAKTTRNWLSFNNWCPADKIPNREVKLGNLAAGNHTIKLDVPDAVFNGSEGYFPISMYIQNRKSGQELCPEPLHIEATGQSENTVYIDWTEMGEATEWEIMYGRRNFVSQETYVDAYNDGETGGEITDLTYGWYYDVYVRAICSEDHLSLWTGPFTTEQVLSVKDEDLSQFSVYPNPVIDQVQIESKLPIRKIELYNAQGQKVVEKSTTNNLSLSQMSKGIYMMRVYFENGEVKSHKLIKL